jgi:hypothetical protein
MPAVSVDSSGNPLEPIKVNHGKAVTLTPTGTVIANAAAISSKVTLVTGDDTAGVILPSSARPGDEFLIYNVAATAGLKIYPPVNGTINGGSANAAVAIEGKSLGRFVNLDGTNWGAQFTANS